MSTTHSVKARTTGQDDHTIASPHLLDTDNQPRPDRSGEGYVWVGYQSGMCAGRFHLTPAQARTFAAQLVSAADARDKADKALEWNCPPW